MKGFLLGFVLCALIGVGLYFFKVIDFLHPPEGPKPSPKLELSQTQPIKTEPETTSAPPEEVRSQPKSTPKKTPPETSKADPIPLSAKVLQLSDKGGTAPISVSVTGPTELTNLREGSVHPLFGCGFMIDWGDGSKGHWEDGDSCALNLSHTYNTSGTYLVTAKLWHPDATKSPVIDWKGQESVLVLPGTDGDGTSEVTLETQDFKSVYGYESFPEIVMHVKTLRPSRVEIKLINRDSDVILRQTHPVSYEGEVRTRLLGNLNKPLYLEKLLKNKNDFKIVVDLISQNKILSSDESDWFALIGKIETPSINDRFTFKSKGKNTIELFYNAYHPTCLKYKVDWGDNSKNTRDDYAQADISKEGCRLKSTIIPLGSHTYTTPGDYTIRFYANEFDLERAVDDLVAYIEKTITITPLNE